MFIKDESIYRFWLFLIAIVLVVPAFGQTNPAAQSLPYSQTFSIAATSTTYPAGWQGWNLSSTGSSATFRTNAAVADQAMTASANASTNIGGVLNYNGKIGFAANGTSVDAALCLVVNTTGLSTIQVTFDVMTIRNPYDGATNTRINGVDLQYRLGTTGTFTSATALANGVYQNNTTLQTGAVTTAQNLSNKVVVLPSACNNQSVVQLRWVQRDVSGGGSRPSFAIDNVSVCQQVTPTISITGPANYCTGNSATLVATFTNGGTLPVFQWKKNGVVVGANSPVVSLSGLAAGDQLQCVMTSNVSCASATTISSNTIVVGTIRPTPTLSTPVITSASCPSALDGAVNITAVGGTAPYTYGWDTVNRSNGPLFGVTVANKTTNSPVFGLGFTIGFVIDGIEGKELTLTRGIGYDFSVFAIGHPFHISTDNVGGNTNNIVLNGQAGAPSTNGTINFRPNSTHGNLLYYACQNHQYMGYKVNLTNGYNTEDLTNARAGQYSVVVTDANGCYANATYTVTNASTTCPRSITVTKSGSGSGVVVSSPSGINCGATCFAGFTEGAVVTLTATPDSVSTFVGWSGSCSGTGPCTVTLDASKLVNAQFEYSDHTLTVSKNGTGTGVVTASVGAINCGAVCSGIYPHGSIVTLEATPDPGYYFTGWTGGCSGTAPCTLTLNSNVAVQATFSPRTFDLNVSNSGGGTVTGTPLGINCGSYCNYAYDSGTVVTLTPTPDAEYIFAGWTGDCSGYGPCVVALDQVRNVGASFLVADVELTVFSDLYGNVVSFPGTLNCSSQCSEFFGNGMQVTLTPVPISGYMFNGWSGDCTGSGPCVVTMNASRSVTASFVPEVFYILNTQLTGTGSGLVSSTPLGIDCGVNCTNSFLSGTSVTLEAQPGINNVFVGWSGDCIGTGPCVVNMNAAKTVYAQFDTIIQTDSIQLDVHLFIQGLYQSSQLMTPVLYNLGLSNDTAACDSLSIELHESSSEYALVSAFSGLLKSDGSCQVKVPPAYAGNSYYLVIKHRNSIETWSKEPVLINPLVTNYSFSE